MGGRPPATARDALQNYVSQLRKALGSDVLLTRDPGYLLEATPEQIDLGRFERLLGEARGGDAEARAAKLREALGLWRGQPLSDLAYESFTGGRDRAPGGTACRRPRRPRRRRA